MKNFGALDLIILLALLGLIGLTIVGSQINRSDFEKACSNAGGKTVWDGRQFQCVKR